MYKGRALDNPWRSIIVTTNLGFLFVGMLSWWGTCLAGAGIAAKSGNWSIFALGVAAIFFATMGWRVGYRFFKIGAKPVDWTTLKTQESALHCWATALILLGLVLAAGVHQHKLEEVRPLLFVAGVYVLVGVVWFATAFKIGNRAKDLTRKGSSDTL